MSEREEFDNRMPDLPIQENTSDEDHPNYWTSVVWEPMEHFIHAPADHSLRDYHFEPKDLQKVNWPALKVAWQRLLKRLYEEEGRYLTEGNYISRISWDASREDTGGNYVYHNWSPPEKVEDYDTSRASDPDAVKEDYYWLRNEIIGKLGEYNDDFGLPEDLY